MIPTMYMRKLYHGITYHSIEIISSCCPALLYVTSFPQTRKEKKKNISSVYIVTPPWTGPGLVPSRLQRACERHLITVMCHSHCFWMTALLCKAKLSFKSLFKLSCGVHEWQTCQCVFCQEDTLHFFAFSLRPVRGIQISYIIADASE